MEHLRNFMQSWLGKLMLLACALPMVFLGIGTFGGGHSSGALIKLGEQSVSIHEFSQALGDARTSALQSGAQADLDEAALTDEVLQGLIERTLLLHQAQVLGLGVSDDALSVMLQSMDEFMTDGVFDNNRFAAYLHATGQNKYQLFDSIRQSIFVRKLSQSILSTSLYPESLLLRLANFSTQTRPLYIKRFALADFMGDIHITQSEVDAYYAANQDSLIAPTSAQADILILDKTSFYANNADIPEDTLRSFWAQTHGQTHISHILVSNATDAQNIALRLQNGEDFEALAAEHSQDPQSSLGAFNPAFFGTTGAQVSQALVNLEVGQVSEPIASEFGYHLIRVDERTLVDFDTDTALSAYQDSAYLNATFDIANRLTSGESMAVIAQSTPAAVLMQDNAYGSAQQDYAPIALVAYATDAANIGIISPATESADATFWVLPKAITPAHVLTQDEAHDEIVQRLTNQKARASAQDAANALLSVISFEDLAQDAQGFTYLPKASLASPELSESERYRLFAPRPHLVDNAESVALLIGGPTLSTSTLDPNLQDQLAQGVRLGAGDDEFNAYLRYLDAVHAPTVDRALLP